MSNTNPTLMSVQFGVTEGTPGYCWDLDEWIYEANLQQTYGDNMVGTTLGIRYHHRQRHPPICGTSQLLRK
jgi:hypothetical protein